MKKSKKQNDLFPPTENKVESVPVEQLKKHTNESNTPMSETKESKETPLDKIKSWQEAIQKETENVKVQLAKQLNSASETFKMLVELTGNNRFILEPQFQEFRNVLNIETEETKPAAEPKAPKVKAVGGSRKRVDTEEILKWLGSEEKGKADMVKEFGFSQLTAANKLKKLLDEKKITTRKEGTRVLIKSK